MSRVIEVCVEGLWHDTYSSTARLGSMHLATGRTLLRNPDTPPAKLPLYEFILSPEYPRKVGKHACIAYLNKYKKVFRSVKERGYLSKLGLILVKIMPDGTFCLKDGRRRLTAILVLGRQKRIKVSV